VIARRAWAAAVLAALLAGCAGAPRHDARLAAEPVPPPAAVAAPFVAQPPDHCGPAALAMAMAAVGHPVDVGALSALAFTPGLRGALQAEMAAAVRRHGLLAVEAPPTIAGLQAALAGGHPVVVLQNLGLDSLPRWHYAVLVGLDPVDGSVRLHTGDTPAQHVDLRAFELTWARASRWALLVARPEAPPAAATDTALAGGAAALERVDPAAAERAWTVLAARRPDWAAAAFGLGTVRVANGDPAAAIGPLQDAVTLDPGFADAWNNLARARLALGDRAGALAAAERAVALGGPRRARYAQTHAAAQPR
jgi:hypothetical protein